MKFEPVADYPEWLKRDPKSGVFYVDIYRKDRGRICKSTKERVSAKRAEKIGEKIVSQWLCKDPATQKDKPTFAEIAKEFLSKYEATYQAGEIRIATIVKARRYIGKYLIDEFGPYAIDQVTVRVWERFVAQYRRHNPKGNLENHWKHMNYVMSYAAKCELLTKAWCVENPSPGKRDKRVITDVEKKSLFESATPILQDQMLFAATMGMRKLEHLQQSWDINHCCHVNMESRMVTVCDKHSKTGVGRTMEMSHQVYEMLLRRSKFEYWHKGYFKRMMKPTKWVFPNPRNPLKPCSDNKNAWKSAKRKAGIKGRLKYHSWRHTWLTEAAKKVRIGIESTAVICAYAGLSITTFEKFYLKLEAKDTASVANLVQASGYTSPMEKQLPAEQSIVGKLRELDPKNDRIH